MEQGRTVPRVDFICIDIIYISSFSCNNYEEYSLPLYLQVTLSPFLGKVFLSPAFITDFLYFGGSFYKRYLYPRKRSIIVNYYSSYYPITRIIRIIIIISIIMIIAITAVLYLVLFGSSCLCFLGSFCGGLLLLLLSFCLFLSFLFFVSINRKRSTNH